MGEILKHVGYVVIIDLMITASIRKRQCCVIRGKLQCNSTWYSLQIIGFPVQAGDVKIHPISLSVSVEGIQS